MISKQNRFHGRNSLNNVYRKGQAAKGEHLSMRFIATSRPDYRLAVVVSKKVSKSAVVRNRIRRRIYETVRLHQQESGRKWQYDMVISVFDESLAGMPADDLREAVQRLLKKAGL